MKKYKYILFSLLFLSIFSCSEDNEAIEGNNGTETPTQAISFRANLDIQSRMTTDINFKSLFETGDAVGIFAVQNEQQLKASGNYQDNRKLVYDGSIWTLDGEDIFYPTNGLALHFYAYYPYASNVDPTNFNFEANANQSLVAHYNATDLVLAKMENTTEPSIHLQFSHALSLIQVEVVRGENMPAFNSSLEVKLNNRVGSSLVDLPAKTATITGSTTADISMLRVDPASDSYIFRALVPAQSIAQGAQLFSFIQNTLGSEIDYSYKVEADVQLVAGNIAKWKIRLKGEELPPYNYAVGDIYPFEGTPVGIVFEISNGGLNGKVVSLKEKQGRWGDASKDESADGIDLIRDADKGAEATQNLINTRKGAGNFAGDYAMFNWLYTTMNESNVYGDWYAPAKNELKSLYASISGLTYAQIEYTWTDGNPMPGESVSAEDARKAFNVKMTDAGGTAFSLSGQYWAVTEISADKAYSIHFETSVLQIGKFKYDTWGRLRPIMQF